jgi:rubrerythrin
MADMKKGCIAVAVCMGLAGVLNAGEWANKTTLENMQIAFNGESNAKAKYEAFAAKADEEGYKSVAVLFRAAAKSEGIHAAKHENAIKKSGGEAKATIEKVEVKSTKENLEAALKGEVAEKESMYPEMIKKAEADKNTAAMYSFKGALAAEKMHAQYYEQALKELDSWKEAGKEFIVCQVCGYTTMDQKLQKCPVCQAPRSKFDLVK